MYIIGVRLPIPADTWITHPRQYSLQHRPELPRFGDERPGSEAGYRQQVVVVLVLDDSAFRALQMRRYDWRRRRCRLHRQGCRPLRWRHPAGDATQIVHRRRMDGEQWAQLSRRLIIHILVDEIVAGDGHLLGRCRRDADVDVGQQARRPTCVLKAPFPW